MDDNLHMLFIAPLPPPLNGQTLAAQVFLDSIKEELNVTIVDLVKNDHRDGIVTLTRVKEIISALIQIHKNKNKNNIIYLHASESVAGNIRDLIIYSILGKNLSKLTIHFHGGSLESNVFNKSKLLKAINFYFYKKIKNIILLGDSHRYIFSSLHNSNNIFSVHNFSEETFFLDEPSIIKKYEDIEKLKILYLSNLIPGKGYEYLLSAALSLPNDLKNKVLFNFAGGFQSSNDKSDFLEKTKDQAHIQYLGFIGDGKKVEILSECHAVCLPSYILEGQGICLLEGYASGCVAITTGKAGIADIFKEGINGFKIEERSSTSIINTIKEMLAMKDDLVKIALNNSQEAKNKYQVKTHTNKLKCIMQLPCEGDLT